MKDEQEIDYYKEKLEKMRKRFKDESPVYQKFMEIGAKIIKEGKLRK